MKAATAGLIALLGGNDHFFMADLYTLSLQGGTVYRWTTCDSDIIFGGDTFTSATDQGSQPLIVRGPIHQARGLEVSTLDLTLYTGDTAQVMGINAPAAIANGALDGASVCVERAFMLTWGDTTPGTVVLFEGNVAGTDAGSIQSVIHLKSEVERLQVQIPKALFTPGCTNTFGDASCGISLASLTGTFAITTGSTASTILGVSGHADGYFVNGMVVFTSGANAGARRAVSSHTGAALGLVIPLLTPPADGDAFTVYPGCPRTKAGCASFSNSNNFRGCPYIPSPEMTR